MASGVKNTAAAPDGRVAATGHRADLLAAFGLDAPPGEGPTVLTTETEEGDRSVAGDLLFSASARDQKWLFEQMAAHLKRSDCRVTRIALEEAPMAVPETLLRPLLRALAHNQSVREVSICWCRFGDESVCILADALRTNQSVRELDLRGDCLGSRSLSRRSLRHFADLMRDTDRHFDRLCLGLWHSGPTTSDDAFEAEELKGMEGEAAKEELEDVAAFGEALVAEGADGGARTSRVRHLELGWSLPHRELRVLLRPLESARGLESLSLCLAEPESERDDEDIFGRRSPVDKDKLKQLPARVLATLSQFLRTNPDLRSFELPVDSTQFEGKLAPQLMQAVADAPALQKFECYLSVDRPTFERMARIVREHPQLLQCMGDHADKPRQKSLALRLAL